MMATTRPSFSDLARETPWFSDLLSGDNAAQPLSPDIREVIALATASRAEELATIAAEEARAREFARARELEAERQRTARALQERLKKEQAAAEEAAQRARQARNDRVDKYLAPLLILGFVAIIVVLIVLFPNYTVLWLAVGAIPFVIWYLVNEL